MATVPQKNGIWKWEGNDFFKGLVITVLTTALTGLYAIFSAGDFTWVLFKPYLLSSVAAGLAYLLKNLASNNEGKILQKDNPAITEDKGLKPS